MWNMSVESLGFILFIFSSINWENKLLTDVYGHMHRLILESQKNWNMSIHKSKPVKE